jgi:membrane protease YdiL (CAAX protease family)
VGALFLLILERLVTRSVNVNIWWWIVIQTLIFTVIPLFLIGVYGIKKAEVGLSFGEIREGLKYVLAMLMLATPFMVYGASLQSFKEYYPLWTPARDSLFSFIILESAILIMMFNTEFLFRGVLLFSLNRKMTYLNRGRWIAILVHSFVYMLVHIGKPGLEVPYSFFVGIVFGWLALRTRSILPSFIAHWTSSVLFDIFVIVM